MSTQRYSPEFKDEAVRQVIERGFFVSDGKDDWLRFCKYHNLTPSMSRRANCWDNAVAESFFSSLKKERIKKRIYKSRDLAHVDVFDNIAMLYNRRRRHSHFGDVSPEAFEQASKLGLELSAVLREFQTITNCT